MTNDLLTKATALLEARERATQGEVFPYSEPEVNYVSALHVKTDEFHQPFAYAESPEIERFIELAANTSAEIITGYQQLLKEKDSIIQTLEDENEMLTESNERLMKCEAERNDLRKLARQMTEALDSLCSDRPLSIEDWAKARAALDEARLAQLHTPKHS